MKKTIFAGIAIVALFTAGCTSTFLAHKDGKTFHLGNKTKTMYTMLCDSGDFKKILADTSLSQQMRNDLYQYNCLEEKGGQKVKEIYTSLTPGQRKSLRVAFKKNGYDINYRPCCGDSVD